MIECKFNFEANFLEGDDRINYGDITIIAKSEEEALEIAKNEVKRNHLFNNNGFSHFKLIEKQDITFKILKTNFNPEY